MTPSFEYHFACGMNRVGFVHYCTNNYTTSVMLPMRLRIKNFLLRRKISHITLCYISTPDLTFVKHIGRAYCSDKDYFDPAVGERLSLARALDPRKAKTYLAGCVMRLERSQAFKAYRHARRMLSD